MAECSSMFWDCQHYCPALRYVWFSFLCYAMLGNLHRDTLPCIWRIKTDLPLGFTSSGDGRVFFDVAVPIDTTVWLCVKSDFSATTGS